MNTQRKGIRLWPAIVVALLLLASTTAAAQTEAVGRLTGVVTAADGITPIELAAVYVYDYVTGENLGLAFTAPDGWYAIDYLLPGDVLVKAVSMGSVTEFTQGHYAEESAPPVAITADGTASVDFALEPAAFFTGIVTQMDGVTPLARAAVYAYDADTSQAAGWAETRADGTFTLSVPAGAYRLTAYQFDYQAMDYSASGGSSGDVIALAAGQTYTGIAFPLAGVGVVSGAVYQPDGVTPAAGVTVYLYNSPTATLHSYTTTTLPNGTYTRPVLEGTYYVGSTNVTYGSVYYNQKLTLSVADPVSVPANAQVNDLVLRYFGLSGNSSIFGNLLLQGRPAKPNATWSVPVSITLTAQGSATPIYAATITSNDNGVITIDNIPPGTYILRAKTERTLAASSTITLISGGNAVDIGTLREGDANNDNIVNITDFSLLAASFGLAASAPAYDARADFNGDTVININDFSLLANSFGQAGAP